VGIPACLFGVNIYVPSNSKSAMGVQFGDGGHMNALQSLISSTEAGPIRDGLVILADNTAKFTDDVLDLLKEAIRGFDNWDELDATRRI